MSSCVLFAGRIPLSLQCLHRHGQAVVGVMSAFQQALPMHATVLHKFRSLCQVTTRISSSARALIHTGYGVGSNYESLAGAVGDSCLRRVLHHKPGSPQAVRAARACSPWCSATRSSSEAPGCFFEAFRRSLEHGHGLPGRPPAVRQESMFPATFQGWRAALCSLQRHRPSQKSSS